MRRFAPLMCVLLCSCEGDLNRSDSGAGGQSGNASGGTFGGGLGGDGGSFTSSGGTSNPGVKTYPLFVAQGQMGRTVVSCDLGQTWVDDHGSLESYRGVPYAEMNCQTIPKVNSGDDPNCDHNAHPARGIAFGDGDFMANFGWGEPGVVEKSSDGGTWAPVYDSAASNEVFAGLGYVQKTWVLVAGDFVRRSVDGGKTWSERTPMQDPIGNRRTGQTDAFGGRLVVASDYNSSDPNAKTPLRVSSDAGLTWWAPETVPVSCGQAIQFEGGIAAGGDIWLVVSGNGVSCKSTDGGENWTAHAMWASGEDEYLRSSVVWEGTQFQAWGKKGRYSSTDGENWSVAATVPPGIYLGAVATDGEGHFVAATGDYATQKFFTSIDGLTWTAIPEGSFKGSHPLRSIVFGRALKKPPSCQ